MRQYWRCSSGICSPRAVCVSGPAGPPPTVQARQAAMRKNERTRQREREAIRIEKRVSPPIHVTSIADALLKCRTNRRTLRWHGERGHATLRTFMDACTLNGSFESTRDLAITPCYVNSLFDCLYRRKRIADDSELFRQQVLWPKRTYN